MNREELILRLKYLRQIDDEKQRKFRKQTKCSEEVGFLTKETFLIVRLIPKMRQFNISLEDIR